MFRARLALLAALAAGWPAATLAQAAPGAPCAELAAAAWPAGLAARRTLIRQLEAHLQACTASPPFLALYGALWLEEGDPAQALLWLERAILLEPNALGARADHALALAALGETSAREQLALEWRDRIDVPAALKQRLRIAPVVNPRLNGNGRWRQRGDLALKAGGETNLDRAPVLDSITFTSPDGPVELPLANPIRPKSGGAVLAEAAWRAGYDTGAGSLWQAAVSAAARASRDEPDTDWNYLQLRGEYWRGFGPWRTQLHLGAGRSAGPLSEPYNVGRFGAAIERDQGRCTQRLGVDAEARRYDTSRFADGDLVGAHWSGQCGGAQSGGWKFGVEARMAVDRPTRPTRPGGRQTHQGLAARAAGPFGGLTLDFGATWVHARDREAYLEEFRPGLHRRYTYWQVQLEVAYSLRPLTGWDAEALVTATTFRQRSNLEFFENKGFSGYAGLRWRW